MGLENSYTHVTVFMPFAGVCFGLVFWVFVCLGFGGFFWFVVFGRSPFHKRHFINGEN